MKILKLVMLFFAFILWQTSFSQCPLKHYVDDRKDNANFIKEWLDFGTSAEQIENRRTWRLLESNDRPILRKKPIDGTGPLHNFRFLSILDQKMSELTIDQRNILFAKLQGFSAGSTTKSYKEILEELERTLPNLPNNTTNWTPFLSTQGFSNGSNLTRRHAYATLEIINQNSIIKNANDFNFEKQLNDIPGFPTDAHQGVADGYFTSGGQKYILEVKAGESTSTAGTINNQLNAYIATPDVPLKNIRWAELDPKPTIGTVRNALLDNCTGCDRQLTSKQWAIDKFEAFRAEFTPTLGMITNETQLANYLSNTSNTAWYDVIFQKLF